MPDETGLLEQIKRKTGNLLNMSIGREEVKGWLDCDRGRNGGKRLPVRRRTAWIDDAIRWTVGRLSAGRGIALDRLCHMMTEKLK